MKKSKRKYRWIIKVVLCMTYLIVMGILGLSAYKIQEEDRKITLWDDVSTTEQYTMLEISEMSEKFAEVDNKQIHFVIEKKKNGVWRTFLIAIKEKDYKKYKDLIDYSYQRTDKKPKIKKIYGYAREINGPLKALAIKNIVHFLPFDNEVTLNTENFEAYLTNVYLDTTLAKIDKPNHIISILIAMIIILFILLIFTLFDRDKLVDEVDNLIEVI